VPFAAGGEGWWAAPTDARRAEAGFAVPVNLVLVLGVAVLVIGFLLMFIWARRSSSNGAGTPAPQAGERSPVGSAEQSSSAVPLFPEQRLRTLPLEKRRPMPPDAAFGLTQRSQEGPRHLAADTPAPAMLTNQALLAGRVIGSEGRPVSGARLTVSDLHGGAAGGGHSATDGRYRLHLPTGGTYLLVCAAEGYQSTTVMVTVAVSTLVCDIVLGGTSGIEGWIRHQHGMPAAGARVTLTDLRGEVVASTVAGRAGGYRLTGLNVGEYTLVVSSAGAQPNAGTVHVPASGVYEMNVVLQGNGALRGTVRSANGARPVPDASVSLVDGSGGVVAAGTTDADGQYMFAEVPPGGYTLIASGHPPVATGVELTGERSEVCDVTLGAGQPWPGSGTGAPDTLVGTPQRSTEARSEWE
jgi:hypothetical protein